MRPSINPDTMIIERIFQPLVDRAGISPQKAKIPFLRFFVLGILFSYTTYTVIQFMTVPDDPSVTTGVLMMLVITGITILTVRHLVMTALHDSFDVFSMLMRLICVTQASIMALFSAGYIAGHYADRPVAAVTMHSMTLAWVSAVIAMCLNTCREPPPRRRKKARAEAHDLRTQNAG